MSELFTTKLKRYPQSGAMIYIPQMVLDDPSFSFKDGEILRISLKETEICITKPAWFELINWSDHQMREGYDELPESIKLQIQEKGLAPE